MDPNEALRVFREAVQKRDMALAAAEVADSDNDWHEAEKQYEYAEAHMQDAILAASALGGSPAPPSATGYAPASGCGSRFSTPTA